MVASAPESTRIAGVESTSFKPCQKLIAREVGGSSDAARGGSCGRRRLTPKVTTPTAPTIKNVASKLSVRQRMNPPINGPRSEPKSFPEANQPRRMPRYSAAKPEQRDVATEQTTAGATTNRNPTRKKEDT